VARTRKLPTKKVKRTPKLKKPTFLSKIFGAIGRFIKKIFVPFRFVLKPFKSRPMRFIGKLLNKILLINYFKTSWHELRQVTWPGRKETLQLTFAVFIFAIGFGLMIAVVDYGLSKLFQEVLLK
jgi:preprotein translocase SecE subunit